MRLYNVIIDNNSYIKFISNKFVFENYLEINCIKK